MTNTPDGRDPCLVLQTYPGKYATQDPFNELRQDFESCGMTTETMQFRSVPRAGLEALAWTALFCWFLRPFFEALIAEAAKDVYPHLKKKVTHLWDKIFGSSESPQFKTAGPSGPVSNEFSVMFSLWADFKWGRVKLLFLERCEKEEFQRATELFLDMMMAYYEGKTFQDISLDEEYDCYQGVICIRYDSSADVLRVYNPFAHLGSDAIENMRRLETERRSRFDT